MASAHINVNGTGSRMNREYREWLDDLQSVVDRAATFKAVFDQAALGADWEALSALLDLGSATNAETIYNLHGSANQELGETFITQILARLG